MTRVKRRKLGIFLGATVAPFFVALPMSTTVSAAVITVMFDSGMRGTATGLGSIGNANFGPADAMFSSRGFAGGSNIKNASMFLMTDLHIMLTSADTFAAASSCGAGQKTVISANSKSLDCFGFKVKPGDFFWSQIPLSADLGGVGRYVGRVTTTPLPSSIVLFSTIFFGMGLLQWKRRRHECDDSIGLATA